MSDFNQEFTDQLDPANAHSDECADGAVGLVDRTQQLLDEVDQLLGVPPKSKKEVGDGAQCEADEDDMGNSVETLKKFLSDLGESPAEVEDCEDSDDSEEVPDEASDSADAEALESDEPNPPEYEEATSLIQEPEEVADEPEAESEAEEAESEFKPSDDADEVSDRDIDIAAETQIETDDQPNEPEVVEDLNEEQSDNESSEEDLGFDLEAIKRAFEDEFRSSEEGSAEETDIPEEEASHPEPACKDIEESPAVEESKEPFSTESWLAENLDTIFDDEEAGDSTANAVESVSQPTKVDLADDGQLVGTIETRLAMIESSMDTMFQHLENRIEGMFANLSEQVKCLSLSATSVDRVGHEPVDDLSENTVVTDHTEDEFGSSDGAENDADEDQTASSSHEENGEKDDNEDSEKVKALKDQLTSKLREAEIELSINRAKLSQQKATIEQMQADLDRREAALDDKLEQAKKMGLDKKKGLLNRWKRHMDNED